MRNRLRAALAGSAVLLAMGLSVPASAAVHPSTALSATASCRVSFDTSNYTCTVTISGGTAPYSITWVPVFNSAILGGTHAATVKVFCNPSVGASETDAHVTDSAGEEATAPGYFPCIDH